MGRAGPCVPRVLVIGYGNPLRGDDGVGWHAAEELARTVQDDEVQLLARHQLTLELAEPLSRVEQAIFIDACDGSPPGSVEQQPIQPHPEGAGGEIFSHWVDPRALLACAESLYGSSPRAVLFTVAGASFDCVEELSPQVRDAFPMLLERVQAATRPDQTEGE